MHEMHIVMMIQTTKNYVTKPSFVVAACDEIFFGIFWTTTKGMRNSKMCIHHNSNVSCILMVNRRPVFFMNISDVSDAWKRSVLSCLHSHWKEFIIILSMCVVDSFAARARIANSQNVHKQNDTILVSHLNEWERTTTMWMMPKNCQWNAIWQTISI